MGLTTSDIFINVRAAADQAERTFDGLKAKISSIAEKATESFEKLEGVLGKVGKLMQLAADAGQMRQTEFAFKQLHVSLDRFSADVDGTVSRLEFMAAANKALRGEMALTPEQYDTVLKASDALNDQGFGETIEISERLVQALKTGSGRALREFGITLEDTGSKQGNVNELLEKFGQIADDAGPEDELNKRFEQTSAKLTDLTNSVKKFVGDAILFAIDSFGDMVDRVDDLIQRAREALGLVGEEEKQASNPRRAALVGVLGKNDRRYAIASRSRYASYRPEDLTDEELEQLVTAQHLEGEVATYQRSLNPMDARAAAARRERTRAGRGGEVFATAGEQIANNLPGVLSKIAQQRAGAHTAVDQLYGALAGGVDTLADAAGAWGTKKKKGAGETYSVGGAAGYTNAGEHETVAGAAGDYGAALFEGAGAAPPNTPMAARLGAALGKGVTVGAKKNLDKQTTELEKFQAKLDDVATAYGTVYGLAQSATGAAIDAIISGNESITKSIRKAAAQQMAVTAKTATVKAIESGAYALFTGDASKWGAAAEFAATAAAATAAAAFLGGGGGGGGGSSSGYAGGRGAGAGGGFIGGGGGGGGGSSNDRPIQINISGVISDDPRQVGAMVQHGWDLARRDPSRGRPPAVRAA